MCNLPGTVLLHAENPLKLKRKIIPKLNKETILLCHKQLICNSIYQIWQSVYQIIFILNGSIKNILLVLQICTSEKTSVVVLVVMW